ncbi:MAG: tetraacyldisaccharide 4'-kinase [Muribaculaceae bacterium]|nr:tetraacyldisaccharide 4'-kinase [Muribaculaceae bacterium]
MVLLPLSKVYGMVTSFRNKLYDWGALKQTEFEVPVVAVGNLAVGGTGKTPHTEYIARKLSSHYNIAILSRGYKRVSKGFVLATAKTSPRDIGDEPYQMYHKFNGNIMVAVCEKRTVGIKKILDINPEINLILLDDGLQHRRVKPKVSVLLTEYSRPFYKDSLLPYGRLRESSANAERADIVIVTKCPKDLKGIDYRIVKKNLDLIPAQDLFFSHYHYENPLPVFPSSHSERTPILSNLTKDDALLVLCGISNPRPFVRYIKSFSARVKVNAFADHHQYTHKDMLFIKGRFDSLIGARRYIITTEKDAVRLVNNPLFPKELKPYTFFIPIEVEFNDTDNLKFEDSLIKFINQK